MTSRQSPQSQMRRLLSGPEGGWQLPQRPRGRAVSAERSGGAALGLLLASSQACGQSAANLASLNLCFFIYRLG